MKGEKKNPGIIPLSLAEIDQYKRRSKDINI